MENHSEKDILAQEFRKERLVRRAVTVLDIKRQRIRDDLQQMLKHMGLIVPLTQSLEANQEVLQEALGRFGDEAFAQLVIQILQDLG